MSGVKLNSKEVVYDGKPHSLEIEGKLPEGVGAPTYYINGNKVGSAVDVGEYKVVVSFAVNNMNYESIPNMEATLKIVSAEYNVDGIDLVFKSKDGSTTYGSYKIYDTESVTVDIKDRKLLPGGTQISYKISNADGKAVDDIKDVGIYEIKAEFTVPDNKNYKPIQPITRRFEVRKAKYDTEDIHFDSEVFVYDEAAHSIFVTFPYEFDMDVVDVKYEYYLGEELLLDGEGNPLNEVTDAGEYTVKAIFNVKDKNYDQIATKQATLEIKKYEIDIASFYYDDERNFIWDGNAHKVAFYGWDIEGLEYDILLYKYTPEAETEWTVLKAGDSGVLEVDGILSVINPGRYKREITVINNSGNCVLSIGETTKTFVCEFMIQKEINVRDIYFKSGNESYNAEFDSGIFTSGADVNVELNGSDKEELAYEHELYKFNETDSEWELIKSGELFKTLENENLSIGSYKYIVEIETVSEDYILSIGETSMELVYEFYVQG